VAPQSRILRVAASFLNVGCASLATFAAGVVAVRTLPVAVLGDYSVFASGFFLVTVVVTQLVHQPVEVQVLPYPRSERPQALRVSLPLGVGAGAVVGTVVAAISLLLLGPSPDRLMLAASTAALCVVSPTQDALRRMFYLAAAPSRAALLSTVHLAVTLLALGAGVVGGLPAALIPFGGLIVANVVSALIGLALVRRQVADRQGLRLDLRRVLASGGWLAYSGALFHLGGVMAALVVNRVAGPEAVGYAEAARIVAQPIVVLSFGISAILEPAAMEAIAEADVARARRYGPMLASAVIAAGVISLLLVGLPWSGNPLPAILPLAYQLEHLVPVTILATTMVNCNYVANGQLAAGGRHKAMAVTATLGNVSRLAAGLAAGSLGATAIPAGLALQGLVRSIGSRIVLRNLYRALTPRQPLLSPASGGRLSVRGTRSQDLPAPPPTGRLLPVGPVATVGPVRGRPVLAAVEDVAQ
jgi:hypothetical protein